MTSRSAADRGARGAGAAPTPRDVAESAMRAIAQIDATIAGLQAMRTQLLAGVGRVAIEEARDEGLDPGVGLRDAACELALQQRRSDRTVEAELNHAMADVSRWPTTMRAWGEARIHRGHVAVITEVGGSIQDAAERAAFEAALLPHAEETTPGRLRSIARRELERHLDQPLAARHERARRERGVFVTDVDDGMSWVRALVPTALAHGSLDRLTQMAKAAPPDDPRTFDQRRADAFADLLLTGEPTDQALAGITARVSVVIPVEVLLPAPLLAGGLGDDRSNGEAGAGGDDRGRRRLEEAVARLVGGAPVDPETARALASRLASWTRLFTDPIRGQVVAVDTYRPKRKLRRLLEARDQHCRWPGCGGRVHRADIDHTIPWAEGGRTEQGNLAHLCRRHHVLKGAQLARARRWKVAQVSPGVLTFTSPAGGVYTDQPEPAGPVFRETDPVWGIATGAAAGMGEPPF